MWKKLSKTIIGTLFAFALLASMGSNVMADGMIIPNPRPYPEIMNYPEIRYHIVNVEINNQYVVTHINQEFYNPYNETLLGNYVFPIPEGAVISNFVVTVDGHEQTAELMGADEAKELFQQAVINMEDASLLQYFDNNIFSCEVAIPPNGSIQMEIEYEEILTMNNGMYKYLYTFNKTRPCRQS